MALSFYFAKFTIPIMEKQRSSSGRTLVITKGDGFDSRAGSLLFLSIREGGF